MSDREGFAGDDEHTLPKATVYKLIGEMLPDDISCAKDTKEIIVDCCVEWIKLISAQANTVCEESSKKTISPEHVIEALKQLGFESFISEVDDSHAEFKQSQKERQRNQPDTNGMTPEQLQALQEQLFASSQARLAAAE
ncbi:negative cofactor 2 transcription regulator complex subunit ncb2 [Apiotrichum porosum]|uniref:Negative cofactor 2 transcription regulator complex subunit ncb2 n=1 Tax=Apiotrichum porosum TaxID=105984 RepID=A0A427XES3_9TREE|nr:negative cofactor 2 transcription regulator complex subunit ncb2 [Apiotrichum porosum]RSH77348.1 negative cofactor 2 transcription regulator complex subunit ncb2 [Apiotrichum porosum]